MSDIKNLANIMEERDKQYQRRFISIADTLSRSTETLDRLCTHITRYEEDKKHDAEFKKEVREFIKDSAPIINKAKDIQEMRGKILISVITFLLLGILGAFVKFS